MDKRYRLNRELGQGGTAVVYEGLDLHLGRPVALKFLRPGQAGRAGSLALRQEAAAMARVSHDHVCVVYEVTEFKGHPCLVMERLEGLDLKARLAVRPLTIAEVVQMGIQLADALASMHAAGIVHNDIKPANLFVTAAGRVKLLDFGLATAYPAAGPAPSRGSAWRNSVYGTADYIAPERILRLPVTPRSDLFSLGAVLFEMLNGAKPFSGASTAETVFNVLDGDPRPVRAVRSTAGAALNRIIRKLLAKEPGRRYASAADVARALRQISTRDHDHETTSRHSGGRHGSAQHRVIASVSAGRFHGSSGARRHA